MTVSGAISVYVDESIHAADGFIVCAAVAAPDLIGAAIADALSRAGLSPGTDEYKSSGLKAGNEQAQRLRAELMDILTRLGCRIALTVSAVDERPELGNHVLSLLGALAARGELGPLPVPIFMDEGLYKPSASRRHAAQADLSLLSVSPENDSRHVPGLQLADLVAHTASTIVRCELGSLRKATPAGPGTGYDPDMMIELDFELWAGLRYSLAGTTAPQFDQDDVVASATLQAFGLYVSDRCPAHIRDAAVRRFSTVYLGCIH